MSCFGIAVPAAGSIKSNRTGKPSPPGWALVDYVTLTGLREQLFPTHLSCLRTFVWRALNSNLDSFQGRHEQLCRCHGNPPPPFESMLQQTTPLPPTNHHGRGSPARYVPESEQSEEDKQWMREALVMAEEAFRASEVPVGSVFVRKGEIIAKARNRTNELMNVSRASHVHSCRDVDLTHHFPLGNKTCRAGSNRPDPQTIPSSSARISPTAACRATGRQCTP